MNWPEAFSTVGVAFAVAFMFVGLVWAATRGDGA